MASTQRSNSRGTRKQTQAVGAQAGAGRGTRLQTTLGDLIAAAFDVAGTELRSVAEVVSSRELARLTRRPIVIVS